MLNFPTSGLSPLVFVMAERHKNLVRPSDSGGGIGERGRGGGGEEEREWGGEGGEREDRGRGKDASEMGGRQIMGVMVGDMGGIRRQIGRSMYG